MVKGVFFDLYGTLLVYGDMVSAWGAWLTAFHGVLGDAGLTLSREQLSARCEGFFARPEPSGNHSRLTLYEQRISDFCTELGLSPPEAVLQIAARESVRAWQSYVTPDPEAHDVLARLNTDHALALITNFDHPPHVHEVIAEAHLADYFDAVVVSAEVGIKKPDPRIFAPALLRTELNPAEVVFVGDTADDVNGAQAAGMRAVLIRRDGQGDGSAALDYTALPAEQESRDSTGARLIRSLAELPGTL